MKLLNWPVTPDDARPAGPPDKCFYCGLPMGAQHSETCVIRERTVVVAVTIKTVMSVPESWTAEDIENHYNNGRWCADNVMFRLNNMAEAIDKGGDCMCPHTEIKYIGEATYEDGLRVGVDLVADNPTKPQVFKTVELSEKDRGVADANAHLNT